MTIEKNYTLYQNTTLHYFNQIIGGNFTYLSYHETSIKEHQAIVKVFLLEQMGGK